MSTAAALATLHDYVVRSTHWQEGGATRHDAMLALGVLGVDVPAPYKPKPTTCWACSGTGSVTTSSNGSGLIEETCAACEERLLEALGPCGK
jgi:hypothetical protein